MKKIICGVFVLLIIFCLWYFYNKIAYYNTPNPLNFNSRGFEVGSYYRQESNIKSPRSQKNVYHLKLINKKDDTLFFENNNVYIIGDTRFNMYVWSKL